MRIATHAEGATWGALPFQAAIDFFRRKGLLVGWHWQDVQTEAHAVGFTVAKMMRADLLGSVRDAVDRALADGETFRDFSKQLTPVLQRAGWWGEKTERDPLTGRDVVVQLGSPRRLEIIFDTNLATSYSAGQWEQIQRTKARRPFLRYVHQDSSHPRPQHQAWHGLVLPADDAFWQTHFPPNGWGCHCTVQQVDPRDLTANGWSVGEAPPLDLEPYENKRTGETRMVPRGIDPGFDTNPGAVGLAKLARQQLAEREVAARAAAAELA